MAWQDTFVRANNASSWNNASNGESWSHPVGTATTAISGNEGTLTGNAARQVLLLGSRTGTDVEILVRTSATVDTSESQGPAARSSSDGTNFYCCFLTGTALSIAKIVSGTSTTLATTSFTPSASTFYWIRLRVQGSALKAKIWQDGTAEPTSWTVSTSDSTFTSAGLVGLRAFLTVTGTVSFDNFLAQPIGNNLITNRKRIAKIL